MDIDYWAKRHAEEIRKLRMTVGTDKANRMQTELEAFAKTNGWTEEMLVNKIVDARERAFTEAINK